MLLNIWLVGVGISLAVLKIDDFCEGCKSWRDFLLALVASLLWFLYVPLALYRLWREIQVEKAAKEGEL